MWACKPGLGGRHGGAGASRLTMIITHTPDIFRSEREMTSALRAAFTVSRAGRWSAMGKALDQIELGYSKGRGVFQRGRSMGCDRNECAVRFRHGVHQASGRLSRCCTTM